jgi:hypothetical protein
VDDALRERHEGRARTGFVDLRSFDEGVAETLGAKIDEKEGDYFLNLEPTDTVGFDPPKTSPFHRGNVQPRPGLPGIPITFFFPEDVFKKYSIPLIWIRRESVDPAMQRWHPGMLQYRTTGRGAIPVQYKRTQTSSEIAGFDRVEQVDQAAPFDLIYTINVVARTRTGAPNTQGANRLLRHVLGVYPPYCEVRLKDSIGDFRTYEAFMEGVSPLDDVAEIADRVIGFAVSLRIEGELDLVDPVVRKTVTQQVTTLRRR